MNHGGRLTSVQDSSRAAARVGEVGSHVGAGLEPGSCKVGEVREAGGNRDARCGEGGRRRPDGCMSGGHSTHISKFEFLRNGLCFFFLFFFCSLKLELVYRVGSKKFIRNFTKIRTFNSIRSLEFHRNMFGFVFPTLLQFLSKSLSQQTNAAKATSTFTVSP